MKRLLLLSVILMSAVSASSAQFSLTKDGFVSVSGTSRDYVVFDIPGKTQAEIFKAAYDYLSLYYAYPEIYLRTMDRSAISVNYNFETATPFVDTNKKDSVWMPVPRMLKDERGLILHDKYAVDGYSINLMFKDEKLRVGAPRLTHLKVLTLTRDKLYLNKSKLGPGMYNEHGILRPKYEKLRSFLENFFNDYTNDLVKAVSEEDQW